MTVALVNPILNKNANKSGDIYKVFDLVCELYPSKQAM